MKKKFYYTQNIEINVIDLLICHNNNLFELIKIKFFEKNFDKQKLMRIFEKKFQQTKINDF